MIYGILVNEIALYLYHRMYPNADDTDFREAKEGTQVFYEMAKDILSIIGIVEEGTVMT